jgi:hypothetical protein
MGAQLGSGRQAMMITCHSYYDHPANHGSALMSMMNHPVRRFTSLRAALKELEPSVRNGSVLQTGRGFRNFGDMRPREVLANLLLCIAVNHTGEHELTFTSDPTGGDGIILDVNTGETWPTEHVMVSRYQTEGDVETRILQAIESKVAIGEQYARGKTLIVFLDTFGPILLQKSFGGRCRIVIPSR